MNRDKGGVLVDAATVLLPLFVVLILLGLFLVIPLVNRYRRAMHHLRQEHYPVRLGRALMKHSGIGQRLEHAEDDGDEEEEGEAAVGGAEMPIYLDWNATSQVYPEVALKMLPYLYSRCGNPGSAHAFGRSPRASVARARKAVAALVGAESPEEIVFASCGTEAINWALRSGIRAGWARKRGGAQPQRPAAEDGGEEDEWRGRRPHVVTTAVEHPAVLALLRHLEAEGSIDLDVLGVCGEGIIRLPELAAAFRPDTVLVAVMHANNEVGSLQPVAEVAALCKTHGALLFVDAAQSVGKVPVDVNGSLGGADMVSIVGHKFGAPKGVAALYVRRGLELKPMLIGGGQEQGRRSGTECVLLLAGLGEAAAIAHKEQLLLRQHLSNCTKLLRERLVAELGGEEGLRFNGPADPSRRLPNTLSVSFQGLQGPRLVAALADAVALSAGSACHAHGPARASAVLEAMHVPSEYALGTLRISCGRHTTVDEVWKAARLIAGAVKRERARVQGQGGQGAVVTP